MRYENRRRKCVLEEDYLTERHKVPSLENEQQITSPTDSLLDVIIARGKHEQALFHPMENEINIKRSPTR